ncbi:germination protein YpeB [Sporolactobacillus sp. THM7-4]|nr:germination protein YpeB [Sporolactobacillus sp. THM7-4]
MNREGFSLKRSYWIILCSILAALMVGLGIWANQEHRAREAVMIQAENHYQQAFHELAYYVDSLEESLGTSLAMHSRESMRPQLVETWRLSALAHGAANELPLTLLPFNRTNEFLAHVGDFTYNSGVKTTGNRPLSDKEYRSLQKLYKESMSIRDGLRDVQSKVMAHHLRWMDVEQALQQKRQNQDNQVIDGLKRVNVQATDYTQSFSPENPRNTVFEKQKLKPLEGSVLSPDQAATGIKKWLGVPKAKIRQIRKTGKGSSTSAYEITLINNRTKKPIHASITRKGGHVIWFMNNRPVGAQKISFYEATKKAKRFLDQHRLPGMELVKKDQFDKVAVLTFVEKRKNIRVYPSSIRLQVALDNGEVVAFDESDYLFNKCDRVPLIPKMSEQSARRQLNPDLRIQETHLAVFQNPLLKNVLCYEFFATKGHDTYRVLLNAENGDQEKVELLRD